MKFKLQAGDIAVIARLGDSSREAHRYISVHKMYKIKLYHDTKDS